jgi:hypothetical protein
MTLYERAALLLVAETELATAERTRDVLAAELLAEVEDELAEAAFKGDQPRADAARRIEIPGALVSYVPAGSTRYLLRRARTVPLRLVVVAAPRSSAESNTSPPADVEAPNAHQILAELAHHVVAHPLWGVTIALRTLAEALERGAERLHASTARAAWPAPTPRGIDGTAGGTHVPSDL